MLRPRSLALILCACASPLIAAPITAGAYTAEFDGFHWNNGPWFNLNFNGPQGLKVFSVFGWDFLADTYLGDKGIFVYSGEYNGDPLAVVVDYSATPCFECPHNNAFTPGHVGGLPFSASSVPYPAQYVPNGIDTFPRDFAADAKGMLTGTVHARSLDGHPNYSAPYTWDIQVNNVPEPAGIVLTGCGVAALLALKRRRVTK